MIPTAQVLTQEITEITHPNNTYKIVIKHDPYTDPAKAVDRINGNVDDLESVKQAVYLILGTERYQFPIYSWDYGVELIDLFGKPMPYVMSELPRRIKDALIQDNRIEDVVNFEFEVNGNKLHTTFTVVTNLGNLSADLEVTI